MNSIATLKSLPLVLGLVLTFGLAEAQGELTWKDEPGYKSAPVIPSPKGDAGFTRIDPVVAGISFTNLLKGEIYFTNTIAQNGAGLAAGDVDGDGWCDLYFCTLQGENKLFRNLGGWKFAELPLSGGADCKDQFSTGAVLADVDGDHDLDLLVNAIGSGTRLFINDGSARFSERKDSGLLQKLGATSMALADADGDGDLDLYVTNYRSATIHDQLGVRFTLSVKDGKTVVSKINGADVESTEFEGRFMMTPEGPLEMGEQDAFYLNDGTGRFSKVEFRDHFKHASGTPVEGVLDWGLAVMFRDMNGDLAPDIYVCNDHQSPDRFWINDGRGHFQAAPLLSLRQTSLSAMGVDFADINQDGLLDFFVADMLPRDHSHLLRQTINYEPPNPSAGDTQRLQVPRNTLFLAREDGTYAEIAQYARLEATDWSWSPIFLDVDLDGYEDLLVSNGFAFDIRDKESKAQLEKIKASPSAKPEQLLAVRKSYKPWESSSYAFRNLGYARFEDATAKWRFDQFGISHAMCLADLDNDGDMDLVVNNLNRAPSVHRNDGSAPRVAIRLKGAGANSNGTGALIKLRSGNISGIQEMISGGRYLAGDHAQRTFAALDNRPVRIEVRWRTGRVTVITNAPPNHLYEIAEPTSGASSQPEKLERTFEFGLHGPLFVEASRLLNHSHSEAAFDDFARQPMLPRKLSHPGPPAGWFDVNGDGWDDLLVGTSRSGNSSIFFNEKGERFTLASPLEKFSKARGDQIYIGGFSTFSQEGLLFTALSSYEARLGTLSSLLRYNLVKGANEEALPIHTSNNLAAVAFGDIDGDGDLDLCAAGGTLPGRYPLGSPSAVYMNEGGVFRIWQPSLKALEGLGIVNSVIFTDLTGDGYPELVFACEWGPVRVFSYDELTLNDLTTELGLDRFVGWWNGVASADVNADGLLDLVASNWGRNHKYARYREKPVRLYYSDGGSTEPSLLIETIYSPTKKDWVPLRDLDALSREQPILKEKFSHAAFPSASIPDVIAASGRKFDFLEANWLESTVFLNRGNSFEGKALPMEAQISPAFGISVADFDGNGTEDIFLAQNFFETTLDSGRCDAGRGLVLVGDGSGSFKPMPGTVSGVRLYGQGRASATADYDGDARVDLVVTENGGHTALFHNEAAKPGIRVRLLGEVQNSSGVGALLRPILRDNGGKEKLGAAREIQAGSGYKSHPSVIQVLPKIEGFQGVWVRWPGGKTTRTVIDSKMRDVTIDSGGELAFSK